MSPRRFLENVALIAVQPLRRDVSEAFGNVTPKLVKLLARPCWCKLHTSAQLPEKMM